MITRIFNKKQKEIDDFESSPVPCCVHIPPPGILSKDFTEHFESSEDSYKNDKTNIVYMIISFFTPD